LGETFVLHQLFVLQKKIINPIKLVNNITYRKLTQVWDVYAVWQFASCISSMPFQCVLRRENRRAQHM